MEQLEMPDEQESLKELLNVLEFMPSCIARGMALLIRVSSPQQRKSVGSIRFQREQIRFLTPYGASLEKIRLFDATGESAKPDANRPVFQQLLAAVRAGEVGVVIVADVDRVARNDPHAEALYNAIADVNGVLVINGEICNPANHSHRLVLRIRTAVAQFENDQRVFRSTVSRGMKAESLEFAVALPTGLIWACPDDPGVRAIMEEAGLGDLMTTEALSKHRTKVKGRDGRRYFVFPHPDRDVRAATRLAIDWLIETGDLGEVLKRIASDSRWPHPGQFPVATTRVFRPDASTVKWKAVINREDGKHELGRARIHHWLQSEALFGTYRYDGGKLTRISPAAAKIVKKVHEPNAFPGLASNETKDRVAEILRKGLRPGRWGSWKGHRNHALRTVRCAYPLPLGRTCGRQMGAVYSANAGYYKYMSGACEVRGHSNLLPKDAEQVVIDTVLQTLKREDLEREMSRLRRSKASEREELTEAQKEVKDLESDVNWVQQQAQDAARRQNNLLLSHYTQSLETAIGRLDTARKNLRRVQAYSGTVLPLTDNEYADILRLASDLPALIERARKIPGKLREVLAELVACVHTRRLGAFAYHFEVEFRSGVRIKNTLVARPVRTTPTIRMYAATRLSQWLDPRNRVTPETEAAATAAATEAAEFLNRAMRIKRDSAWTADRVFTAAVMATSTDFARPRKGFYVAVEELAKQHELELQAVLRAALYGRLGPARVGDNGAVMLAPTAKELEKEFASIGLRSVAEAAGWQVDDVISLTALREVTGWDFGMLKKRSQQLAGIHTDAAGRRYTRRSLVLEPLIAVRSYLDARVPKWADRSKGKWITLQAAQNILSPANAEHLAQYTAVVRPGFGENGRHSTYVWLEPSVEAKIACWDLDVVVNKLGLGLSPADFAPRDEVKNALVSRSGARPSNSAWKNAVTNGHIIEVVARSRGTRHTRHYAYVPKEIINAKDPKITRQFLRGEWRPTAYPLSNGESP